jgi:hypothetical protein
MSFVRTGSLNLAVLLTVPLSVDVGVLGDGNLGFAVVDVFVVRLDGAFVEAGLGISECTLVSAVAK